jgi:hypothetical protein
MDGDSSRKTFKNNKKETTKRTTSIENKTNQTTRKKV